MQFFLNLSLPLHSSFTFSFFALSRTALFCAVPVPISPIESNIRGKGVRREQEGKCVTNYGDFALFGQRIEASVLLYKERKRTVERDEEKQRHRRVRTKDS